MKKCYIAQKPCTFGGQRFCIDDEIPAKLVDPRREKALVKYGIIKAAYAKEAPKDSKQGKKDDPANTDNQDVPQTPDVPQAPDTPDKKDDEAADGEKEGKE